MTSLILLFNWSWFGFSSPWGGNLSSSSKPDGWSRCWFLAALSALDRDGVFILQYYNISDMFRPMLVFIKLWITETMQMLAFQVVSIPKRKITNDSKSCYCSPSALLLALARPTAPAPPSPGKACPAWSSPWSPWSPVNTSSLVRGAWWNSLLLFSRISACLELILTASFTCLFGQLLKLLRAVIVKSTFSPPCSNVQCFHKGFSCCSFLRPFWCSSPRE